MKKFFAVFLGVLSAIGGFVDMGDLVANAAVGARFGVELAWVVVVGIMPRGASLTIDPWQFMSEKTLKGTFLGSARVREDVPRLIDLYQSGDLELDRLVSRTLRLDELPDAFDRLRAGDVVRQVVVFD